MSNKDFRVMSWDDWGHCVAEIVGGGAAVAAHFLAESITHIHVLAGGITLYGGAFLVLNGLVRLPAVRAVFCAVFKCKSEDNG